MTALNSGSVLCRSRICSLRNPLWRPRGRTGRRQYPLAQCLTKDLAHVFNEYKTNVFEWFLRDLVEVTPILLRKDNRCDACSSSGKYFFLHAANRQHVPTQCDFARHCYVLANWSTRQC